MDIVIEKNVPVPNGRGRKCRYPWAGMEVGDSFLIPEAVTKDGQARSAAYAQQKVDGRKYRTSRVDGGVRVWRIE